MAESKPTITATPFHSRFGNWAQIASALISLCGFAIIIVQINLTRQKASQEAFQVAMSEARKVYMSYSESTLKYPELSTPDYDLLMHNHIEYLRYQNFVSHMLYGYDEILGVVGTSDDDDAKEEWLMAFKIDIEAHQRYLCQIADPRIGDPRIFKMYRPAMQERLAEANRLNCKDMKPLVEEGKSPLQHLLPH